MQSDPFGSELQVKALQNLLNKSKCRFYGVGWKTREHSKGPTISVLIYDDKLGLMFRIHHTAGGADTWDKWTGVTSACLVADTPWDGFDCGHLQSGVGHVGAPAEIITFVRGNGGSRLAHLLR